jgi:hypothetical protein
MKSSKSLTSILATAILLFCTIGVYGLFTRPTVLHGGATLQEDSQALPGDNFSKNPDFQNTLAVTVNATPEQIWPWLVQLGQDRAGFYSFEFLEDLFPCKIDNTGQIRVEWQSRQVGEYVSVCPGVGGWWVESIDPAHFIAFRGKPDSNWSMSFVIVPIDALTSRLITRSRYSTADSAIGRLAEILLTQPAHSLMQRGVLLGVRSLAEGRSLPNTTQEGLVWWSAFAGFLAAGLWLIYRRQGWQFIGLFLAAELYLSGLLWQRPPVGLGWALNGIVLIGLYFLVRKTSTRRLDQQPGRPDRQLIVEP